MPSQPLQSCACGFLSRELWELVWVVEDGDPVGGLGRSKNVAHGGPWHVLHGSMQRLYNCLGTPGDAMLGAMLHTLLLLLAELGALLASGPGERSTTRVP